MYHCLTSLYWDGEQVSSISCPAVTPITEHIPGEHQNGREAGEGATAVDLLVTFIPKIGTAGNECQ